MVYLQFTVHMRCKARESVHNFTLLTSCHSNTVIHCKTRKPCCRKGTVRCRSCCFWFKVRR